MISLKQAKRLKTGNIVYHVINQNTDGTPQRWRVNGKVKTWKKNLDRVSVPIKSGMYSYNYLTERDLYLYSTTEKQALRHKAIKPDLNIKNIYVLDPDSQEAINSTVKHKAAFVGYTDNNNGSLTIKGI